MSRKIEVNPVTRVEGHGKVTLQLSDDGAVEQARLHIIEFRGFEKFVQGRPFWEMPVLSERMCGICPVSHHLAAAKTGDMLVSSNVPVAVCRNVPTLLNVPTRNRRSVPVRFSVPTFVTTP